MSASTTTNASANASGLEEVREHWEEGLTVTSLLPPSEGRQLVVLTSQAGDSEDPEYQWTVYHCHRYWELAPGQWQCSVDATYVPLEGVWWWLAHQCAMPVKVQSSLPQR